MHQGKWREKLWCIQTGNNSLVHTATLANFQKHAEQISRTQEDILSGSIYRNFRRGKTNPRWKKNPKTTITVAASGDGEEWLGRDVEELSGEMEMFQIIGLWITCMCPYVRLCGCNLWISVYVYFTSKNCRKIIIKWRVGRGKNYTRMARYK